MSLRIAFDLDGVLADMEAELVRQAEIVFGESMTRILQDRTRSDRSTNERTSPGGGDDTEPTEPSEGAAPQLTPLVSLQMTARQERRLWRHVESIDGFWESLQETEPGVVARLATLARDRRWEVIFLTKRPQSAGATAQVQTQRWREAKGFTLPSVFVMQGSRGRVAAALALNFVVDDRPENCLDVVLDSKARAILVWRDDDQRLPATVKRPGIGVVKSVDECLNILGEIDPAARHRPGVVGRVKRFLRLSDDA